MILGISGVARSGKDSCADVLEDEFNFVRISYGDAVKRAAREAFDFSEEQLWGDLKDVPDHRYPVSAKYIEAYESAKHLLSAKEYEKKGWLVPRRTLTSFGDAARALYPNTWVDITLAMVDKIARQHSKCNPLWDYHRRHGLVPWNERYEYGLSRDEFATAVVLPDCRYKNEMDAIRLRQGRVIRVRRPNAGLSGLAGEHSSETAQQEIPDLYFDAVIENTGTLEELHEKVLKLVACWK